MFGFSLDRRTILIIIGVLVAAAAVKMITDTNLLTQTLISAPAVLIAITFHEFAHGFAAYKLGDDTAKREGRLSLNPFAHLDPIGTVMLLVAGFGWGKPVHVDPRNYKRTISMDKADAIVSAAGPLMNIFLALVFTLIYYALFKFAGYFVLTNKIGNIIAQMIGAAVSINIGLGIFNLIPLPPLDGSKIIKPFLSINAKEWFENNEQMFYIVFIVIWITGIASMIISPIISGVTSVFLKLGGLIFGL